MTGGDDILYLITLRNLEIHLVIGLCCFEVCFGTGLLTGLHWPVPITLRASLVVEAMPHHINLEPTDENFVNHVLL